MWILWDLCWWHLMCQPASRPWPLGILKAVCTSGLTPLSLPSTPTPGKPSLLCPVLWTHCLLWTGARTCCLFPSSLFHSPLTLFYPIGLLPTLLQLPGCISNLGQKRGGEKGWDTGILCKPCYYSASFLIDVYLQYFLFFWPLGDWGSGRYYNLQDLEIWYIIGEHPLWMQRFYAPWRRWASLAMPLTPAPGFVIRYVQRGEGQPLSTQPTGISPIFFIY